MHTSFHRSFPKSPPPHTLPPQMARILAHEKKNNHRSDLSSLYSHPLNSREKTMQFALTRKHTEEKEVVFFRAFFHFCSSFSISFWSSSPHPFALLPLPPPLFILSLGFAFSSEKPSNAAKTERVCVRETERERKTLRVRVRQKEWVCMYNCGGCLLECKGLNPTFPLLRMRVASKIKAQVSTIK